MLYTKRTGTHSRASPFRMDIFEERTIAILLRALHGGGLGAQILAHRPKVQKSAQSLQDRSTRFSHPILPPHRHHAHLLKDKIDDKFHSSNPQVVANTKVSAKRVQAARSEGRPSRTSVQQALSLYRLPAKRQKPQWFPATFYLLRLWSIPSPGDGLSVVQSAAPP